MSTASVAQTSQQAAFGEAKANSIGSLVFQARKNFLDEDLQIMDGLTFNQYKKLKTIHYYLNSRFEDGDVDDNGNEKFFHNIATHRNSNMTKNIDLDTKDMYVDTTMEKAYWLSWILREELRVWMRDFNFASHLNQLAEDLPKFGSVVWKKIKTTNKDGEEAVTVENVDLRDLILDQSADTLKQGQLVIQRHLMTPYEIRQKSGVWDAAAIEQAVKPNQQSKVKRDRFLRQREQANVGTYSETDTTALIEVYEVWGYVPETCLPVDQRPEAPDETKYRYCTAIISGIENGEAQSNLYFKIVTEEDFPYKEFHLPRKMPGRWLAIGNVELLIPLQIRMNELTNRFYRALRIGSLQLFQTRGQIYLKNLLQDAQEGDIIETSNEISPIATELRAFNQYQNEARIIEDLADKMCSTFEVVTGESLPAATPFRLGAQLSANAGKIFEVVRENCGIVLGQIFEGWIIPALEDQLTAEHVLSLVGSVEEFQAFDQAYRRSILLDEVKHYVLKTGYLPTEAEFKTAESVLSEQLQTSDRKLKIEKDVLKDYSNFAIRFSTTGENVNKQAETESLGNILTMVASNPAILQDKNARMIIARIMEGAGISPLKLAAFASEPVNPAAAPGAAAPAMKKFAQNPGDAGLTPERAVEQSEAAGAAA